MGDDFWARIEAEAPDLAEVFPPDYEDIPDPPEETRKEEGVTMTEILPVDPKLRSRARRLIRQWTKEEEGKPKDWWNGVAPSYLCTEFEIDYDEACAILLDLQARGFIYDNGNGNYHELEDGRVCTTRFYMR